VTNEQLKNHRDRINLYYDPSIPHYSRHADGTTSRTSVSSDNVARLAYQWRTQRKKAINSLNDLILCYYSDFKIICIPSANDPPHIINQQYTKLGELIATGARDSENARKIAGLLMTTEDLDYYLEQGFDHFSTSKLPFNFLQAAVQAKPVSIGFSDHLLRTALILLKQRPNDSGSQLLENLAPIVASCIFLDVIRKRIPYKGQSYPRLCLKQKAYPVTGAIGNSTLIFETYRRQCEIAQAELYQKHWRCEEKDRHGKRCANSQNGHTKGHQDDKGKVFRAGEYWATSELDSMHQIEIYCQTIITYLQWIFSDWEKKLPTIVGFKEAKRAALNLHLRQVSMLYSQGGANISRELTSHTTCSCCLISSPLHPLFCGHVICQECLESFAKKKANDFQLSKCPLHDDYKWMPPWKTSFNHPTTGLRILCLDGYVWY